MNITKFWPLEMFAGRQTKFFMRRKADIRYARDSPFVTRHERLA
jgi:hypothetical protein